MQFISFDSHKHYTWACVERADGSVLRETRVEHEPGALRSFLKECEPNSEVAIETIGSWYWIVDEVESAGCVPRLVHARKAKLMMGMLSKTDRLDARGLNRLQRTGTLPTVWIPPGELRDLRELPRTRMVLVRQRTQLKNRIQSTLCKYGLRIDAVSDVFGKRGKEHLRRALAGLPCEARYVTEELLAQEEILEERIARVEQRMKDRFSKTPAIKLLMSMPGVGFLLATVMAMEIGDVGRFPRADHLASYAGLVPRVHSSGGKTRYGRIRPDVNRYLKWAYVEAANSVARHRPNFAQRHIGQLYDRLTRKRGGGKAKVAVGRHLAEATYWMLKKGEPYREPSLREGSSTGA